MGSENTDTSGVTKNTVSRRRVVAGAVWAVPVVMIASAAPAAALSGGPLSFTGAACKLPGNSVKAFPKSYRFTVVANNPIHGLVEDYVLVITNVAINGVPAPNEFGVLAGVTGTCSCSCSSFPISHQVCVQDGTTFTFDIYAGQYTDSANAEMTIDYSIYACGSCTTPVNSYHLTSGVLNTPPCP